MRVPWTQVEDAKRKAKEAQDELQASQYQSGSIHGKMLMNKCKELQEENDQLGKDLSEGRVQKLLADAALQKEYAREQKKALVETREWVEHLTDELDTSQVQADAPFAALCMRAQSFTLAHFSRLQALVLSLRRELNAAKSKLPATAAP